MKKLSLSKNLAFVAACASLALSAVSPRADTLPINAAALFAHIGGTFVVTPTGNPGVINVTAHDPESDH